MECLNYLQSKDPIQILLQWVQTAKEHSQIKEPMAMAISTVNEKGMPFSRVVLAKDITHQGITFYTNQQSQKGLQLEKNPCCSLLFYWDPLFRQINITGKAKKISREKTIPYWNTRPRKSQISQWISVQSKVVKDRETLLSRWSVAEKKWEGQPIACPENWFGYQVAIESIEFWMGRDHRLHDRFLFKRQANRLHWSVARLFP